jgi:hypothetical protein
MRIAIASPMGWATVVKVDIVSDPWWEGQQCSEQFGNLLATSGAPTSWLDPVGSSCTGLTEPCCIYWDAPDPSILNSGFLNSGNN